MEEQQNVEGAQDPAVSSRAKDALFADEPPKTRTRAKAQPKAKTKPEFQEPVVADDDQTPEPHTHTAYEEEAVDTTVDDADFTAEEQNKKGGDA